MTTVAITELKASLSEYVDRVRAGEEVLVTDRGTPVAKLVPLTPQADAEAGVASLIRAGLARPPAKPLPKDFFAGNRDVEDPEGRVLKGLLDERESGW